MTVMNEYQDLDELAGIFAAGDAWLLKYGVVGPHVHNNIVLNLRTQFPKIQNIEYYLDSENRIIDLTIYVNKWFLIFGRKKKLLRNVFEVLMDYLHGYEIKLKLRRYKPDK